MCLLGVPAVGRRPDEEISGIEQSGLRHEDPQMVVGFPLVVEELQFGRADLQGFASTNGVVGKPKAAREDGFIESELALVHDAIIAVGEEITFEACGAGFVRDDARAGLPFLARLGLERCQAENVVDVAVGIDRCMDWIG